MYKWKPSKTARVEFAKKMQDIDSFCTDNNISRSTSSDSYYFSIGDMNYRVSNHSIDSSNAGAYDCYGNQIRDKYHDDNRSAGVTYIHASKTRIIEIYTDLKDGYKLDGHGYRVSASI